MKKFLLSLLLAAIALPVFAEDDSVVLTYSFYRLDTSCGTTMWVKVPASFTKDELNRLFSQLNSEECGESTGYVYNDVTPQPVAPEPVTPNP